MDHYLLLLCGVVVGYCLDEGRHLWRRVRDARQRDAYFADVRTLARRGGR